MILTPKKAKLVSKNYVKNTLFPKGTWHLLHIFYFQGILPPYLTNLNQNLLNLFTGDFVNR